MLVGSQPDKLGLVGIKLTVPADPLFEELGIQLTNLAAAIWASVDGRLEWTEMQFAEHLSQRTGGDCGHLDSVW